MSAPLAPVAVALTAGVVADRCLGVPPAAEAAALLAGALGCLAARYRWPAFAVACAAAGALYHHQYRDVYDADDVGHLAAEEPQLVRLRGVLADEPALTVSP